MKRCPSDFLFMPHKTDIGNNRNKDAPCNTSICLNVFLFVSLVVICLVNNVVRAVWEVWSLVSYTLATNIERGGVQQSLFVAHPIYM